MKPQKVFYSGRKRFVIRPYQRGDEEKILSSWRKAFGKDMSPQEWHWKYPANPRGFRCLICLSEDEKVVAHFAGQVMYVSYQGDYIYGLHLVDCFSHPAYRWAIGGKTGLFVRVSQIFLNTYLEDKILPEEPLITQEKPAQFYYGFPGERHFRLGNKLMGYRFHRPGILYFQSCKPPKKSRALFLKAKLERLKDFKNWDQLDSLFTRFQKKYRAFCIVRNSSYLSWRFSRPGYDYFIFYLKNFWGEIKAWTILNIKNKLASILDFLAENEADITLLLSKLHKEIEMTSEVWLAGNHPFKRAFLNAGFIPKTEPIGIIPVTKGSSNKLGLFPHTTDNFFFTMADADLF